MSNEMGRQNDLTRPSDFELSDDCRGTLRALMDAYAGELVRVALAGKHDGSALTPEDLRHAAEVPSKGAEVLSKDAEVRWKDAEVPWKDAEAPSKDADTLHVGLAASSALVALGLVALAASVVPRTIHGTAGRVALAVALIGFLASVFFLLALYLTREVGVSLPRGTSETEKSG